MRTHEELVSLGEAELHLLLWAARHLHIELLASPFLLLELVIGLLRRLQARGKLNCADISEHPGTVLHNIRRDH